METDKADKVFSKCVKARAMLTCEGCGQSSYYYGALDCAHIHGRANKSIRQHPLNAVCLCRDCHLFYTREPDSFTEFISTTRTEEQLQELTDVKNNLIKYNDLYVRDCAAHYRLQLKEIESKRLGGDTGYIDFEPFY